MRDPNHHRSRLRQSLNYRHPRHDRRAWKMTLKMRLIHRDVFDTTRRFHPVNIFNPIDQKEGITMGKNGLDQLDVSACEFGHVFHP